jgi:hypothetical protein
MILPCQQILEKNYHGPAGLFDGSVKAIEKSNQAGLKQRLKLFTRTLIVYIFTPKRGTCRISAGGGETIAKESS